VQNFGALAVHSLKGISQAGTCVKWDKDGLIALDMFKEAKITFDPVGNADQVSD